MPETNASAAGKADPKPDPKADPKGDAAQTQGTPTVAGTPDVAQPKPAAPKGKRAAKPDEAQLSGAKMPAIGDVVHYVLHFQPKQGTHRPMTVTSIAREDRASVNGQVMLEPGDMLGDNILFVQTAPYSPDGAVGTWHYAEDAAD